MKKVLIITYYWPPSGGSGVQRWLKFSKYLPEYGYEPIVLTPENPSFINKDPGLMDEVPKDIEVLKLPIWEPYQVLARLSRKEIHQKNVNVGRKQSFFQKISLWIRGNMFIPDPRMFWVRPVVKFLKGFLPGSGIDCIITTGPPHSMHLIGLKLKEKTGIKWIADFRDPWSEWDVMDSFFMTPWARKKHQKLELKTLQKADHVISVGWEMDKDLKRLGARRSSVITNGFDLDDFQNQSGHTPIKSGIIKIRHIGTVDELRNPRPLLKALSDLIAEGKIKKGEVEAEFIGNVNPVLKSDVENNIEWSEFVIFTDYMSHKEIIRMYGETDILLLVLAHSHSARLNVTGKIFEYVASGIPVLGIGDPEGDAARVLTQAGAGKVIAHGNEEELKLLIIDYIENRGKRNPIKLDESPFTRKNLTKNLAKIIDEL